jgi:NAD(P)-dependent dehydrogenase (short-subunit alcohol dehydrogenase family)
MGSDTKQVALVTGANKGIGFAIARKLGELGATVYLGSRDQQRGVAAEKQLRAERIDARALHLDVTDAGLIAEAARRVGDEQGRLDALVNNAAVGGGTRPAAQTSVERMRRTFETNVFGVVAVTNAFLPLLQRSSAGRIVNVSTLVASLAYGAARHDPSGVFPPGVFPVLPDYASSKAALNALTIAYANELRDTSILVNAVSPGFVATDINAHQGHLSPEQGARIPVRLATLGPDGPTARFIGENGTPTGEELAW